jgi:hypothetical protein
MAFDTQITDLVGGTIDQTACDQWAADACKEIIHQLPTKLKAKCSTISIINATNGTTLDLDGIGDVLSITRLSADSGGYYIPCREVPAMYGDLTNDSTSLDYYANETDPAYYITSNSSDASTLFVKPTPTDAQPANAYHITYPTVDVSAVSVIANFPDEAEYLVVLYVSIKQLHQYMNSKRSDLPSDLVVPVLETVSESLPTWSAPDDFVTPVKPAVPSLSAQSVTITGTAPTFTKPTRAAQTTFKAFYEDTTGANPFGDNDPGALSITAVDPPIPSLTTITFSSVDSDIDAYLPTYTTSTITVGGVYGANTPPTFSKPAVAPDFSQVNTYIDTDEDIELASAKLQEISVQLSKYQADIQNEQIEFNKENVAYQANIQEAMQELQVANQVKIAEAQGGLQLAMSNENRSQQRVFQNAINDMKVIFDNNSQTIQKFQSEVQTYQINVNKEVQEYGQKLSRYNTELNTVYTSWAKIESDNISGYQADIQNELNRFNDENVEYQAKFQKDIQDAGLSDTNEGRKLQKYQSEVGTYGSELNANVQTFTQALTKNRASFDTSMQKYTSELQKASSLNASSLQKFQAETADYSAKLQKQGIDYQWYQGQYAALKADYQQGLQQLIGGGGTPPSQ